MFVVKFVWIATYFCSFHRPCHYMITEIVFFIMWKVSLNEERFFSKSHFVYRSANFALNLSIFKAPIRPLTTLVPNISANISSFFFLIARQADCCPHYFQHALYIIALLWMEKQFKFPLIYSFHNLIR